MESNQQPVASYQQPELGIECPTCGCRDLRVQHTKKTSRHIKRYRTCRHCGRNIVTTEKIEN